MFSKNMKMLTMTMGDAITKMIKAVLKDLDKNFPEISAKCLRTAGRLAHGTIMHHYELIVSAKDLILYIIGQLKADGANYNAVEFHGETIRNLSIASRMVLSNLSMEMGAKVAFVIPDEKTIDYLKSRAKRPFTPVQSDTDAIYEHCYEIDVSALEPQVACPHNIDQVKPISEITKDKIRIHQAFLGSCTNGRYEDLEIAAQILQGNTIHPDVRMIVIPASMKGYKHALQTGVLEILVEAEAMVCNPTCGPCPGSHMGLIGPGERCIASSNRNFQGRMGSPESEVYLASPATVAASAITGYIADPRQL